MRIWGWAIAAVLVWALAAQVEQGPAPLAANAPAADFSAPRAKAALSRVLGPQAPHPVGSSAQAAVHGRLLQELKALGVQTTTVSAMSCYDERGWITIHCATVSNIIAEILPGPGKAVVLMAHTDSVNAGPGAGDDGLGVATILETIRALKAAPQPARHPLLALFTDGEEYGLLGGAAFARDPVWRDRAGLVVNVEARGDAGESLLFQTSPGDGALIDLYARTVPHPATGSLYREIYRLTPAETDLSPVMEAGLPGYNFANIDDISGYHTPLDRIENLDPRSLQSAGDNVLALTRALEQTDFEQLKGGNAVYVDVMGWWVPRLPASWALPLSDLAFLLLAVLAWRRRAGGWRANLLGFAMPPVLVAGAFAAGWALQWIAVHVAGHANPAFAHPFFLRAALALGVWAVALVAARGAMLWWSWLWLAGLAVAGALLLPGASPYLLFPVLMACLTLPFGARWRWLAAVPALTALMLWLQLTQGLEVLMGLSQPAYIVVPLAAGLIAILGLSRPAGMAGALFSAALALAFAVTAGLLPPFDASHPDRDNLFYVEAGKQAFFVDSTKAGLPASTGASPFFAQTMQLAQQRGRTVAAGAPIYPAPTASVSRQGGDVAVDFQGNGDTISLSFPATVKLQSFTIGDLTVTARPGQVGITCASPDCGHAHMVLHLASAAPFTMILTERNRGLPDKVQKLAAQRPATAVPSQVGDTSVLVNQIAVPGAPHI